jgi:hypothetical protein
MRPIIGGLAALTAFAAIAGPACANPFDSLRWRVEDAIADTAARKVESVLSGEGKKKKEKPAKPAPAAPPAPPAPPSMAAFPPAASPVPTPAAPAYAPPAAMPAPAVAPH